MTGFGGMASPSPLPPTLIATWNMLGGHPGGHCLGTRQGGQSRAGATDSCQCGAASLPCESGSGGQVFRETGTAGGESDGAEIRIPSLQESKNRNGSVVLEKHILKRKIQRNQTNMYTII